MRSGRAGLEFLGKPWRVIAPLCVIALSPAIAAPPPDKGPAPVEELRAVLDEAARWQFERDPVRAAFFGVPGYYDQLPHQAPADLERDGVRGDALRERLRAIPSDKLSPREAEWRSWALVLIDNDLAMLRSGLEALPWNQMDGSHQLARVINAQPLSSPAEVEAWNRRIGELPRVFDEEIANARRGIAKGVVLQRFAAEQVLKQVQGLASQKALHEAFVAPVAARIKASDDERKRVLAALDETTDKKLLPAYLKLADFLAKEVVPSARTTDGFWALPNGPALYALSVRSAVTTSQSPAELHEIGLKEVARLEAEMLALAKTQGYATLAAWQAAMAKKPEMHPKDAEALLAEYRRYSDEYKPLMARQFGRLPKANLVIDKIESFREANAAFAEYVPGAPDGSRPGRTMVNTYHPSERSRWDIQDTAYHEGAPGHHLQLMIMIEDGEAPVYLRSSPISAFMEGWALYAEALPDELGLYREPWTRFGRLDSERFRAVRLVVDTGIHLKKWTREKALEYVRAHTALPVVEARAEIDRYTVWPGQALGYKVGQMRIRELRAKAEKALGTKFDLRAFHDAVLIGGARPLDVLSARIDRWLAEGAK